MMLRVALARLCKSSPVVAGGIRRSVHHSILRPFSTPSAAEPRDLSPFTVHTINLALHYARSYKSDESYETVRQMLEQQIASQSQEGQGMALLALSTLLFERGNTLEARQTLLKIQDLTSCCLATRVAAFEALVGLHLEMGRDSASSVYAYKGLSHIQKDAQQIRDVSGIEVLDAQAKAIKGLVQLVRGDLYSANASFQGFADKSYTVTPNDLHTGRKGKSAGTKGRTEAKRGQEGLLATQSTSHADGDSTESPPTPESTFQSHHLRDSESTA